MLKKFLFVFVVGLICISNLNMNVINASDIISHDRIWEYYIDDFHNDQQELSRYRFGDKVEKYGKTYTQFILFEREIWKPHEIPCYLHPDCFEYEWHYETTLTPNEVVALIREEGNKVFRLIEDAENELRYHSMDPISTSMRKVSEGDEVLLYNFDSAVGDYYDSFDNTGPSSSIEELTQVCVVAKDEKENMGNKYDTTKVVTAVGYNMFIYVTSIGNHEINYDMFKGTYHAGDNPKFEKSWGIEYAKKLGVMTYGLLSSFYTSPLYTPDLSILYRVYEKGDVIYENIVDRNTISTINDNKEEYLLRDQIIYDIMGCEIKNPLPGTIYIKNGKKFVAK